MFLLFINYVKARRIVNASCLCLPVAAAASGRFWPGKNIGDTSLYLWASILHGRTGEDSDGRLLSSDAEAMLGVFLEGVLRVIYRSLYVGLSSVRPNFEEGIFFDEHLKIERKHNLNPFAPTNTSL